MGAPRWRANSGHIPKRLDVKGAKVQVELRGGIKPPEAWEATRMRWSLQGDAFDVIRYKALSE